jgi:hypothetical protein
MHDWTAQLRVVAIHEYAHLHVAKHFGIWGWVHIRPNPRANGLRYAGQFTAEPSEDAYPKQIIGLAGVCAEEMDRDAQITPALMLERLRGHCLSPTDREMAGDFDVAHVEQCVAILRSTWPDLIRDAHGAIELERREAQRARVV